jgi:choline dehydrogenase-like flavoprotein
MSKAIASWGWSTIPQKHLRDHVPWFTQAKVIGGGALRPSLRREVLPGDSAKDRDVLFDHGCRAATDHHPVGTCRMGTDAMAVADPGLRVRGLRA